MHIKIKKLFSHYVLCLEDEKEDGGAGNDALPSLTFIKRNPSTRKGSFTGKDEIGQPMLRQYMNVHVFDKDVQYVYERVSIDYYYVRITKSGDDLPRPSLYFKVKRSNMHSM